MFGILYFLSVFQFLNSFFVKLLQKRNYLFISMIMKDFCLYSCFVIFFVTGMIVDGVHISFIRPAARKFVSCIWPGRKKAYRASFGRQSSRFGEYFGQRISGLSAYGMVKIRFIPPRPNSVLYAFFRPGQSMLKFFVSGGQSTPITLFYALDGHRIWRTLLKLYFLHRSEIIKNSIMRKCIQLAFLPAMEVLHPLIHRILQNCTDNIVSHFTFAVELVNSYQKRKIPGKKIGVCVWYNGLKHDEILMEIESPLARINTHIALKAFIRVKMKRVII